MAKYRVTTKEYKYEKPIVSFFEGDVDEEYIIDFFGLRNPDVEWYHIDKDRHFLSEDEFKEFVLEERVGDGEFSLKCLDSDWHEQTINFRDDWFHCRIILYTYPMTLDVGIIQEDVDNGWDDAVHDVWEDITKTCGWEPFIEL